MIKKLNFSQP